jgi:hypothetical protein
MKLSRFTSPVLPVPGTFAAGVEIFGFTIIGWIMTPFPPWLLKKAIWPQINADEHR